MYFRNMIENEISSNGVVKRLFYFDKIIGIFAVIFNFLNIKHRFTYERCKQQ